MRYLQPILGILSLTLVSSLAHAQGERLWYKIHPNAPLTGFTKENQLLATDSKGNCYMVARTARAIRDSDIEVMKYSPTGELLWERWISGTAHSEDRALSIAVDNKDNLILAGYVDNEGTGRDALLTKFSPEGETVFSKQVTGKVSRSDEWRFLLVDRADNLYVVGTHGTTSRADSEATLAIQAYSPSGSVLWSQREERLTKVTAQAVIALRPTYLMSRTPLSRGKELTSSPPTLVMARFQGEGLPGLRFVHYDLARGTLLATQEHKSTRFTDPGYATPDRVADLGALRTLSQLHSTSAGQLLLMGNSEARGHPQGAFVISWDTSSNPVWATRFEATNGEVCSASAFRVDAAGNVYLGGHNRTASSQVNGIVAKISATGRVEWQRSDRRIAWVRDIAVDSRGRLIAIGRSEESRASVMMFTPDGVGTLVETLDASDYRFGTTSFNGHKTEPSGLALAPDGSLYMGGDFGGPGFAGNLLVKYRLAR